MFLAVLTVSDRCARGAGVDTAGPRVAAMLGERWPGAGIETALVPDEADQIAARIRRWADQGARLILTAGGTGLGPRDVTPEATRGLIEREAPGLAEAMRAGGAALHPRAWLSRGVAGLRGSTLIINLPGSLRGAEESLAVILPLLDHALEIAAGGGSHA